MKSIRSAALCLLFGSLALPCLADVPYNVDSPNTQEKQHNTITLRYISTSGGGKETEQTPDIVYLYGITSNFELKVETALTTIHSATVKKVQKPREAGLGDSYAQLKWRFANETKTTPGVAIGFKAKLPTADRLRGLGSGSTDYYMWLTAGKSFGRFRVYGNVGYNALGAAKQLDNAYYGVVLSYKTTEKLTLGLQFYGNGPKALKAQDDLNWGVGAAYRYAPDHTLSVCVGKSERGYSNLNLIVGLGFTFK